MTELQRHDFEPVGDALLDELSAQENQILLDLEQRTDLSPGEKLQLYANQMNWVRTELVQKHPIGKY